MHSTFLNILFIIVEKFYCFWFIKDETVYNPQLILELFATIVDSSSTAVFRNWRIFIWMCLKSSSFICNSLTTMD